MIDQREACKSHLCVECGLSLSPGLPMGDTPGSLTNNNKRNFTRLCEATSKADDNIRSLRIQPCPGSLRSFSSPQGRGSFSSSLPLQGELLSSNPHSSWGETTLFSCSPAQCRLLHCTLYQQQRRESLLEDKFESEQES